MGVHMCMHMSAHEVYICFCFSSFADVHTCLPFCLPAYLPSDGPTHLPTDRPACIHANIHGCIHTYTFRNPYTCISTCACMHFVKSFAFHIAVSRWCISEVFFWMPGAQFSYDYSRSHLRRDSMLFSDFRV